MTFLGRKMARRRVSVALFCLCASLIGVQAASAQEFQPLDPMKIVKMVDSHYNHLKSLRTMYTEHYSGMGQERTERGTLLLKKPGRMRWNYETPAGKVFVFDGKFAYFYTPGDAQAQRIPAKQLDDLRSPLRFLLGHTELAKELDQLRVTPEPNSGYRISGVPKGLAQRVQRLSLVVRPTGAIAQMEIDEIDGAVTSFSFEAMQEDVQVDEKAFEFDVPPGVTVVDGLAPL